MLLITNKKMDVILGQMKALQAGNNANMINNFATKIFPSWSVIKEMDAYQTMDMIFAVVSKLATCSAMIPFYAYDKVKDTDLPDSDPLTKFLVSLDYEEKIKLYTYFYLNGEVFMYKQKIDLGKNAGDITVLFLHPSRISLQLSSTFPVEILGYSYFDLNMGIDIPIALDEMVFIKRFNPSENIMDEFRGLSAVKVLTRVIGQVKSSEDVTVAQLQNGGTPGIVYDETPGLDVTVIGNRRDNFSRFIRNGDNKGAPYFSANKLGYISLGTPLTDMEVTSLAETNFDRVCNVFGVSSILFNNKKASTESNVQEMIKEMYTNTIIPNIYLVEGKINKDIVPDLKTKGIVKCDTSEIKALRDDETKKAAALAAKWWLTGNEKREADEYDQDLEDPLMNKYLVPSGFMLLDDLNMVVPPVDNTANDYNHPAVDANGKPVAQATVVPLKTGTNG